MTTENGVIKAGSASSKIAIFVRKRQYLEEKIAYGQGNSFDEAELAALIWAVPVLEAERDNLARLNAMINDAARARSEEYHQLVQQAKAAAAHEAYRQRKAAVQ